MNFTQTNTFIAAMALVIIAIVQVSTFTVGALDFQTQIDNAYAVGYDNGNADGFSEGCNATDISFHELNCHCDSCVESGRYTFMNETELSVNPFK